MNGGHANEGQPGDTLRTLDDLAEIARRALPRMMDEVSGLFVHKETPTPSGFRTYGRSPLYTAMALIGATADDPARVTSLVPSLDRTLQALYEHGQATTSTALRGTAMWALTLADDARGTALIGPLERERRLAFASTWEIGLLLSGLSSVAELRRECRDRARAVASECVSELRSRFSPRGGLFRGHGRIVRPTAILERNLTSFANQAYSIHGLAVYGRAMGDQAANEALLAAERIVEQQGSNGQWWWLYSAATGNVVERYPVFSVHQDGMAFMALVSAQEIGGSDFGDALSSSVKWLVDNELGKPLVDAERAFIARCIQRVGSDADGRHGVSRRNRVRAVLRSLGSTTGAGQSHRGSDLEVLEECRPYHLGWILYARSLARRARWAAH